MTVKEYLDTRAKTTYKKQIRILSASTKRYLGIWTLYPNAKIQSLKVTTKIIFIFIETP